MDTIDIQRKAEAENKKTVYIFNPLIQEFKGVFDGKPYTIPSKENKAFLKPIARVLGNKIVDLYLADKIFPSEKQKEEARKLVFGDEN